MADPLSVVSGVIAVLQATNKIITLCYDYRSAYKGTPTSLSRTLEEVKDLRAVLETLEKLADPENKTKYEDGSVKAPAFPLLCDPDQGPLAMCNAELTALHALIATKKPASDVPSRRRALMQALSWNFKDADVDVHLQRISRCKQTLLLGITADEATLLRNIYDMTSFLEQTSKNVDRNLSDLINSLESTELNKRQRKVLEWLSPVDPSDMHVRVSKSHQQGTGRWMLESKPLTAWLEAESQALWISGLPGSGKTVLLSSIIQSAKESEIVRTTNSILAFFYCDFRNAKSCLWSNVIGSLVAQVCAQTSCMPTELLEEYEANYSRDQNRRPSAFVMVEALRELSRMSPLLLLIDALDECEPRAEILELLETLQRIDNVRVLVTSRDESDVRNELISFSRLKLETYSAEVNGDIAAYLDHRLNSDRKLQWLSASVRKDISAVITEKAAGMFRWAQCQLDEICQLHTVRSIRKALTELPQGLDETYERMLKKVHKSSVDIVRRTLLWASFCIVPLTLDEVYEAIAIEEGLDSINNESRLSDPQKIIELCGSLVSLSTDGHLSLAHLSVRDYLTSSKLAQNDAISAFSLQEGDSNHELATSCLTYLNFKELKPGPSQTVEAYLSRTTTLPLLRHVAKSWPYYSRKATPSPSLKKLIRIFFSPSRPGNFMSWIQALHSDATFKWNIYPRHATPLYYAASFGLDDVVRHLIAERVPLNVPGSRFGGTALHGAVYRVHVPVVKLLLQAGADAKQADFNRVTPLHSSAAAGSVSVMRLLLDHGASPEALDGVGETPLDWAVKGGQEASERLLRGLEVEVDEGKGSSSELWTNPRDYFPQAFYDHRSGVQSSIIVGVRIGGP